MDDDTPMFIAILAVLIGLWFMLWVPVGATDIISTAQGGYRCRARGFEEAEVIVHYPDFWNVDTYCYSGESLEGTKL